MLTFSSRFWQFASAFADAGLPFEKSHVRSRPGTERLSSITLTGCLPAPARARRCAPSSAPPTDGPDDLAGLGGEDTLFGSDGDDTISGGDGLDRVVYPSSREDFQ